MTKDEARQKAIDWQMWASGQNLSYLEILRSQKYFKELGEKHDLIEEFEENGII